MQPARNVKFLFLVGWIFVTGNALANPILWPVDDITRVLPTDSPPPPSALNLSIFLSGARTEYVSFGLALWNDSPITALQTRISRLACAEQESTITVPATFRFAQTVPVQANTRNTPQEELAFIAPARVPDPLLPDTPLPLEADQVAFFWVTVEIPQDALPGHYTGTVTMTVNGLPIALPLALDVWNFDLPPERHLNVTIWFNDGAMCAAHGVERFSKEYWRLLKVYAENMARHRQNVILVPLDLIQLKSGFRKVKCDFDYFDRYVETFLNAGFTMLELSHLAHFGPDGWDGSEIVWRSFKVGEKETAGDNEELIAAVLGDLVLHLQEKGWLEVSAIHVADEPSVNNLQSWKEHSALIGRVAPGLRRMDAIEAEDFRGFLEIWVPKLQVIEPWKSPLRNAVENGAELWFYTCCHPYGVYPNRFLDSTLLQLRLLPWMAARYNLKGYLHWALNQWGDEDPYQKTALGELPPGDHCIVYPGKNGPNDSIRWEVFRDGLEDYEYLQVLEQKLTDLKKKIGVPASFFNPHQRVDEWVSKPVPDTIRYTRSHKDFQEIRRQIAKEIEDLDATPLLLVQTSPPEGTELGVGPATVIVRGLTESGALVTVNEKEVKTDSHGYFAAHRILKPGDPMISIEARTDTGRHIAKRRFRLIEQLEAGKSHK